MSGSAISVAALLDEAASRAGAGDWDDLGFVRTLELFVESCRESAGLTPSGWEVLRKVVLRHLRNRLALQRYLRDLAGLPAPPDAPLVITGLPRTGTTLIHNLLAQDREHRVLRVWEALRPAAAAPPGGPGKDVLVAQAESWLKGFYAIAPRAALIHPLTARGPEECDALLQNSFASQHFDDMFDARRYSSWYAEGDLRDAYRYYALQLAVLSDPDDRATSWVLKSPAHLGHLDELLSVLPGAMIVHCHRDPTEAVGSYASLIRSVREPHTERLDPETAGRQALHRTSLAMARAQRVRASTPSERFADVSYERLVREPLKVVADVYARAGRPLPGTVQQRMRQWLADNPQHRLGVHRYGLAEFGLRAGQVTDAFASYLESYGELVGA